MAEGEDFHYSPIPGEGFQRQAAPSSTETIKEKKMSFEQASKCLNTLGRDETGSRYAYLNLTATDMKLTDVSVILNFKHVLFVDLSGNYLNLDSLQVVTKMPFLVLLKAERNRLDRASLNTMHYLQVLALNQNQIKQVDGINQPLLDSLELNYNDIYEANFENTNLTKLKQLELRSNLLFDVSGFYPASLVKLYMAGNKIAGISSLVFSRLAQLEVLHLRENHLQNLDGFSPGMAGLKYINLRDNKISRFAEFRKLGVLPKLEVLIVTGNPLPGAAAAGEQGEGGVARDPLVIPLLVLLPTLKRINKSVVTVQDRIDAEDMTNDVLDMLLNEEGGGKQETDRDSSSTTDNRGESEVE